MKTKIANALFIFLLIICVILLSFPAYRKFFPPMTVVKDKINRQSLLLERMQKNIPAAVMLQTKELLPEMIDSSVSGIGAIIDPSGLILTNWHLIADAETIRVKLSSGDVLSARVAVFEPENDIALLQLKNPGFGRFFNSNRNGFPLAENGNAEKFRRLELVSRRWKTAFASLDVSSRGSRFFRTYRRSIDYC